MESIFKQSQISHSNSVFKKEENENKVFSFSKKINDAILNIEWRFPFVIFSQKRPGTPELGLWHESLTSYSQHQVYPIL